MSCQTQCLAWRGFHHRYLLNMTTTTWQLHSLAWLQCIRCSSPSKTIFFHSSEGQRSKLQASAGPRPAHRPSGPGSAPCLSRSSLWPQMLGDSWLGDAPSSLCLSSCSVLSVAVSSHGLLMRTSFIGFRAHPDPIWPHRNLPSYI